MAVKATQRLRGEITNEKVIATVASWSDTMDILSRDRINNWTFTYVNISRFVECFNDYFSPILLGSVGLDVLTVLGLCAQLLASGTWYSVMRWLRYITAGVSLLRNSIFHTLHLAARRDKNN